MDLRRSSASSSLPAAALVIPTARRPFQALARRRSQGSPQSPLQRSLGAAAGIHPAVRLRHWIGVAQGSLLLVGLYTAIGAGIGDAAGSVMVGVTAGLIAGVCAVAAILFISGSALAATRAASADRGPRRLPTGR